MNKEEIIIASAYIVRGQIIVGKRHGNVLKIIHDLGFDKKEIEDSLGGFYTSEFRYISRHEAMDIAFYAGQVDMKIYTRKDKYLYSEDLR